MAGREDPFLDVLDSLMNEYWRSGDGLVLLEVFLEAARFGTPVPILASEELQAKLERYRSAECRTLDEALGVQRPKSWPQPAEKGKREKDRFGMSKIGRLWHRAHALSASGMPFDEGMWEALAGEFDISPSRARDWYYEVDHAMASDD